VAAARARFAEDGFAGVSREEIVERAGVTRGAMYHYFASKEALFQAVYEAVEADLCEAVTEAAMTTADPVEQLRLGSVAFLQAAGTDEVRRIVLLDAPSVLDAKVRREIAERYGLGLIRESLREIDGAGRLMVGPVGPLALILMSAMHDAATQIADGADEGELVELFEGLLERITRSSPPRRST
jgi:AcrR family transcriptional regulator